jgi:hypothetical protein
MPAARRRLVAGEAYREGVALDPTTEFLNSLAPGARDVAERLIVIITDRSAFDVAIKWRQLTFAVAGDFDHWICAVAATTRGANLTFHFGSMLSDPAGAFASSDAKYVRKIGYASASDVDEAGLRNLLTQAIDTLPRFRQQARRG